jgi:uncharacterized protein YcgI (DUF1989 family)
MATFIDDTVPLSETGVRCHDLLGTRCDPYLFKIVEGREVEHACHTLLTRAVAPYHLTELDVHDVLNLFQPVHLDPVDGLPVVESVPARPGDYVEFFAEIDLLCALATCHSGDWTAYGDDSLWGAGSSKVEHARNAIATGRPLGVQIYAVDSRLLQGWNPPEPVQLSSVYGHA